MSKTGQIDRETFRIISAEEARQRETINLIPSENYASKAVREALGSVFTNKYSEGYPGKRYYQGNRFVDEVENLAIERAKKLFGVPHANVQPYSGSPANSAVLFGLLNPGDTIMGLSLSAGGHLTHGHPQVTFSGKFYHSIQFGLDEKGLLDYEAIEELAREHRPRLMIIGTTAYPRVFDWGEFGRIADSIGAILVADIAHVAGLIIGGVYPDPVPYAHAVTTTAHKTLRGPRGAMIMVTKKGLEKDPEMSTKIDRAVFPGLQGGPHDHVTAAIAVCLSEAAKPSFRKYAAKVVENAKILAEELIQGGLTLVSGGTDCHLMLIDLRPQGLSGNIVAEALEAGGVIANRNAIPNDPSPPFYPSGLRLGTPAVTTRGMGKGEMKKIAAWILAVIDHVKGEKLPDRKEERSAFLKDFRVRIAKDKFLADISSQVRRLCASFAVP